MNVYEISARYMRRVQMREYEPAEAEISFKAQLAEDEDAGVAASNLIEKARLAVLEGLSGKKSSAPVPTVSAAVNASATLTAVTGTAGSQLAPATVTATKEEPAANTTPAVSSERRGRGRPSKAEMEARAKAAAAASGIPGDEPTMTNGGNPGVASGSDIPDDSPEPVSAKTQDAPAVDGSEIPDDGAPSTAAATRSDLPTGKEMMKIIQTALVKKYISTAEVKKVLADNNVDRLGDIPEDRIGSLYASIASLPGMEGRLNGVSVV